MALPVLTIDQILAWADAHNSCTGSWPNRDSGQVIDAPGEAWHNINAALHQGARGLPAGQSLAQLLDKHRGVPNRLAQPDLTIDQILAWADLHHAHTKGWPLVKSGQVVHAPGEKWNNIDAALARGGRGLPGGSSLAQLLLEHRGVRNHASLPDMTTDQILAWADAHCTAHGPVAETKVWPDCEFLRRNMVSCQFGSAKRSARIAWGFVTCSTFANAPWDTEHEGSAASHKRPDPGMGGRLSGALWQMADPGVGIGCHRSRGKVEEHRQRTQIRPARSTRWFVASSPDPRASALAAFM